MMSRLWRRAITGVAVARLGAAYLTVGALKHVVPLTVLVRWAWRKPRGLRDRAAEALVIARVARLRRWLGGSDKDCIQRSLLLYRGLSAAGADPTLIVGFRDSGTGLEGHASVVVEGELVGEAPSPSAPFVTALTFGREGALLADRSAA
jgi:hypothetical protein